MSDIVKEFTKGLWAEIPPFRFVLGLCPTLAVTKTVETGLGMGLMLTFVLVFSNLLISSLRKVIPPSVRIACFTVIIATFVVIVELASQAYTYGLYQKLGIFIPLIVVNCIVLGRAEAFAFKNGVVASIADGLGMGLGFTLSLCVLAGIRELFGAGTLYGIDVMGASFEPFAFMVSGPGAFVCLGLILCAMNMVGKSQN
jgi:H+/Na+-translocating ferredoxin:NAD+ oxidoreductase subunit E